MFLSRRLAKPAIVALAVAVLAIAISACAIYKFGSLQLSQPGGIGSARVHFLICSEPEGEAPTCEPNDSEGQVQTIVGIAVPKGSSAPATVTAAPLTPGTAPIVFSRNDQAAQSIAEATAGSGEPWPPAGTEGIGYLSAPVTEEKGSVKEWAVDADFGLPTAADGGSFGGPFQTSVAYGLRGVGGEAGPADRPVRCIKDISEAEPDSAFCETAEGAQIGTSDLKIGAPAGATPVFVGGRAPVSFSFDFASTAATLPAFALAATTTVPGGATTMVTGASFAPGPPAGDNHRSPAATSSVMVAVPKNAKPGAYDVTLTATAPQGGTTSQVAKLKVTKPKLKLGGVKLNKANGTATLSVKVPSAGTLTVTGKGIVKAKKKAKKAKKLKITIRAKGKTKAQLEESGKAKIKAKISFKPSSGITVKKTKSITLKQG